MFTSLFTKISLSFHFLTARLWIEFWYFFLLYLGNDHGNTSTCLCVREKKKQQVYTRKSLGTQTAWKLCSGHRKIKRWKSVIWINCSDSEEKKKQKKNSFVAVFFLQFCFMAWLSVWPSKNQIEKWLVMVDSHFNMTKRKTIAFRIQSKDSERKQRVGTKKNLNFDGNPPFFCSMIDLCLTQIKIYFYHFGTNFFYFHWNFGLSSWKGIWIKLE